MRKVLIGFSALIMWVFVVAITVYCEALWWGPPNLQPQNRASLDNYFSTQLQQATGQTLGSAALLLINDRQITNRQTFGIANAETRLPVILDQTLYQMASVSKMVSAWGVMKLVERGDIKLDDPVLKYLKRWQFPPDNHYRSQVTIAQLLSHTGGLGDRLGYAGFLPNQKLPSLEESLTLTKDVAFGEPRGITVMQQPGTVWQYSGGGYTVLQLLIEEVTDQSFTQFMQEQVLDPLGMNQSSFSWSAIVREGEATNLATSFTEELKPSPHRQFTATAAASLYATPADMGRFALANLNSNFVLSASTLAQMWQPQVGTEGEWGLGYALYQRLSDGGEIVGHDGNNMPAINHTVRFHPQTGNAIVLLTSGDRQLASHLGDDWVYWETGKPMAGTITRYFQARLKTAALLIIIGIGAIAFWLFSPYQLKF